MGLKSATLPISVCIGVMLCGCAQPNASTPSMPVAATSDVDSTASASAAIAAAPPAGATVDKQATEALARMGDYLRSLAQFEVHADSWTDMVLDNDQNASFLHHTVLKVRRPDMLRADIVGARVNKGIVYDGRNFVIYSAHDGYYSRNPAPPNLNGLIQELAYVYNIETPLADLFYWGASTADDAIFTSAQSLGIEKVGEQSCAHYVFGQSGLDWEIWIRQGKIALPCRMVITDTSQPSRPRHAVTYRWNLHPSFNAGTFTWRPTSGEKPIELKPAGNSPMERPQ